MYLPFQLRSNIMWKYLTTSLAGKQSPTSKTRSLSHFYLNLNVMPTPQSCHEPNHVNFWWNIFKRESFILFHLFPSALFKVFNSQQIWGLKIFLAGVTIKSIWNISDFKMLSNGCLKLFIQALEKHNLFSSTRKGIL